MTKITRNLFIYVKKPKLTVKLGSNIYIHKYIHVEVCVYIPNLIKLNFPKVY